MKKIIVAIAVFSAFNFSAKAQEFKSNQSAKSVEVVKESNPKDLIYKDINELEMAVSITPELKQDFISLLLMRDENIIQLKTKSEKSDVFGKFGKKLMSALNDDQKSILIKYPDLVKRLTVYSGK